MQFISIYVKALALFLCVYVCLGPGADRCSCSPINTVASVSASCLHAKNSQPCIWSSDSLSEPLSSHTLDDLSSHTYTKISLLYWRVNNISVYMHALYAQIHVFMRPTCPILNSIPASATATAGSLPISNFTPQAYMYLSSRPCSTLGPPGDNRLLGCQAAEPSEMGGMTTLCPLGDQPGTGGEIGKQNGGTERKEKETRERRSERSYSLWCDLTPQGNTVCEWRQKGKVLNHLPLSQFPFPQSDIFSSCPGGYGAHTSDIVHFNAISTTIPWWKKGQWNFTVWREKSFCLPRCHRSYSIGPKGSVKYTETDRIGKHSGTLQRKSLSQNINETKAHNYSWFSQ